MEGMERAENGNENTSTHEAGQAVNVSRASEGLNGFIKVGDQVPGNAPSSSSVLSPRSQNNPSFPGLTRSARVHGTRINTAGWQTLKQSLSRTFFISSHYGLRVLSFKKNKRERERGKWDNVYTDTYKTVHPLNGKTMPGLSGSGSMGIRAEQIKAKDTETKAQCPHLSRTRAHFPAMPRS